MCSQTAEYHKKEGIAYQRQSYCGFIEDINSKNIDGETMSNILIIEFHSDNTTNDRYKRFSGFNITYMQRKGNVLESIL